MKKRFRGTYAELQDQVLLTGIFGEWRDLANHKQFRADDGAILNWWESTGTISLQGPHLAAEELEAALSSAISSRQTTIAARASDVGHCQRVKNENAALKKRLRKLMINNSVLKKRIG